MSGVDIKARAKLNLSLDVLGRREDGFHDLKMVMQSAELSDELHIELTDGEFSAHTNRAYIPCDERNVAVKAAKAFFDAAGMSGVGARIDIEKRIPVCAGLGGGSSDAAAVLRALNELTGRGFSMDELRAVAAVVGSDVSFCVEGGTMLAEGRGERLTELPALGAVPVVICMPPFNSSTPELFSRIASRSSRRHPDTDGLIAALSDGNLPRVARRMYNVFEDVLDKRSASLVNEVKLRLLDAGALGAAMSGTGSAVFGLFPDDKTAQAAHASAHPLCREVFLTRTMGKY